MGHFYFCLLWYGTKSNIQEVDNNHVSKSKHNFFRSQIVVDFCKQFFSIT